MKILYVGDVMGEVGLQVVEELLPGFRAEHSIDLVVAQSENVTEGRGISQQDFERILKSGVDFCTGGNWSLYREDIHPALGDPMQPIVRPANYINGAPGLSHKVIQPNGLMTIVISLLGGVVGRDADKKVDNPLKVVDEILENRPAECKHVIVNFHGDYSSEKVIIGHYLDGRASLVVGDHWHVPTADARVLPKGTAHITDVGMVGVLNSSLGVAFESVLPRWRDGRKTRNVLESDGPRQFNAVLVETNDDGLAKSVDLIQKII